MSRRYVATCDDCGWTRTYQRNVAAAALARHECPRDHRRSCRTCGWSIVTATAKLADRAKRQHSCAFQLEKTASRERGARRRAAIDRTPKPCLHKEADHTHGTYACYVLDFCRCEPCAAANRTYEAERIRQQAYGRWDNYVDATPAREHIRALMDQGMGLKRIVAVSDISQGLLWKLVYGKKRPDGTRTPSKRVRKDTLERILAIELDLAGGVSVDPAGTARRLQALVAFGWSQSKLGQRLGIQPANMTPLVNGTRKVTVATATAVRDLYDDLSMTFPPEDTHRDKIAATRARGHAKTKGWLPPLAWDDERMDDPTYLPVLEHKSTTHDDETDEAAIYRRMHGDKTVRLSKVDAAELVRRWAASGRPLVECERVTGIKPDRWRRLRDQDGAA